MSQLHNEKKDEHNSPLKLLDDHSQSSMDSESHIIEQLENENLELKSKNRELEGQILSLQRLIHFIEDSEGMNCNEKIVKLLHELHETKQKLHSKQNEYGEILKRFSDFKELNGEEISNKNKEVSNLKNQASALENENQMIRRALDEAGMELHKHNDQIFLIQHYNSQLGVHEESPIKSKDCINNAIQIPNSTLQKNPTNNKKSMNVFSSELCILTAIILLILTICMCVVLFFMK